MQYTSRFRRRFTLTGRVGQSKQANMCFAKSRLPRMRALLRFPSRVEGVVEFGFRGFYAPRVGIVVTCENGWIEWDGKAKALVHAKKNGKLNHESLPTKSTNQLQLEAFVKSVRGEKS